MTPQRILFPTDFSTCAERAYLHALLLARRFGATLHVLHVAEDYDPAWDWPELAPSSSQITEADVCADLGIPLPPQEAVDDVVETEIEEVVGVRPADAIVSYADDEDIDLVVMGTHGRRGWRRGLLGSVAEAVVRRAPCPVLTVRSLPPEASAPWPPARVLLAVDLDDLDDGPPLAAQWAAALASAYRAPLDIATAVPRPPTGFGDPATNGAALTDARQRLTALGETLRETVDAPLPVLVNARPGEPAEVIGAIAQEDRTHLLVVGTHGRRGAGRALLGSVAESLMRTAPCPTLVVRQKRARRTTVLPGAAAESLTR